MRSEDAAQLIPPRLVQNIHRINKHVRTNRDFIAVIVSKEGDGKSTLGNEMAFVACENNPRLFNLDHNVYSPETFEELVRYAERYSIVISDEGTSLFLRADANTKWGKQRTKLLSQIRSRNLFIIILLTESGFARVDPQVLHDRCKAVIRITKRGKNVARMWWYSKDRIQHMKFDPEKRMVRVWGNPNWKGNFKPLPKPVYNAYEDNKHEKLSEQTPRRASEVKQEKMLTTGDFAKEVGLTQTRIYQLCHEGKIVGFKIANRMMMIPASEVEGFKNLRKEEHPCNARKGEN